MESRKWLKRKYPNTFVEINSFLNDEYLEQFKKGKYKIGRYKTGELIMFKRSNPVTSYNYPAHYGVLKCEKGITLSGYQSISIFKSEFIEIKS